MIRFQVHDPFGNMALPAFLAPASGAGAKRRKPGGAHRLLAGRE